MTKLFEKLDENIKQLDELQIEELIEHTNTILKEEQKIMQTETIKDYCPECQRVKEFETFNTLLHMYICLECSHVQEYTYEELKQITN